MDQYDQICIFRRCSAHPTPKPLPTLQPKPVTKAGGRRWIRSRLEKAGSLGKERSKQNWRDREREMMDKSQGIGLHNWGDKGVIL